VRPGRKNVFKKSIFSFLPINFVSKNSLNQWYIMAVTFRKVDSGILMRCLEAIPHVDSVFTNNVHEGESVNKTQIDLKRKT
jgi:hypothetical protein